MLSYIEQPSVLLALPAVALVLVAALVVAVTRWRKRGLATRIVRELHPVSQHWLSDFRRSG